MAKKTIFLKKRKNFTIIQNVITFKESAFLNLAKKGHFNFIIIMNIIIIIIIIKLKPLKIQNLFCSNFAF